MTWGGASGGDAAMALPRLQSMSVDGSAVEAVSPGGPEYMIMEK